MYCVGRSFSLWAPEASAKLLRALALMGKLGVEVVFRPVERYNNLCVTYTHCLDLYSNQNFTEASEAHLVHGVAKIVELCLIAYCQLNFSGPVVICSKSKSLYSHVGQLCLQIWPAFTF